MQEANRNVKETKDTHAINFRVSHINQKQQTNCCTWIKNEKAST